MKQIRETHEMRDKHEIHEVKGRARAERGYNLMPVGHEGGPLSCPAGQPLEIAAGVFITVDPASGIALIEASPLEKKIRVAIDQKEVLDVSQLARGSVLSLDGRDYVFLKYMDVFFNPAPLCLPANTPRPARVLPIRTEKPRRQRSVKSILKLALPALLIVSGVSALMLMPSRDPGGKKENQAVSRPVQKAGSKKRPLAAEKPAEKAPETLRDLMAEAPEPAPAPVTAAGEVKPVAIPIKPEPPKQVKKTVKPAPKPAVQPALAPEVLKVLTREYEEAVLIRGYDRDRSIRVLEKLRKKVPAGSALHKKIENALKG